MLRLFRKKKKSRFIKDQLPEYEIGRGSYGRPKIMSWGEDAKLKIGSFCSIGADVRIFLGGEHRMDWVTTYPFNVFWKSASGFKGHPASKGNITIGSDVWIGYHVTILSGVIIGDGAVVGAGAVVSKDVPPYGIVAGNPAKLIRKRFDDETIEQLLKIAWWNWEDSKIEKYMPLLLNDNIAEFIKAAEKDQ